MQSSRLTALAAELTAGRTERLASFWEEMRREGTPLIEPVEGEVDHYWVTFLWRSEEAQRVHVLKGGAGWSFYDTQLTRPPGTDLWYRTCRVQGGARFGYYFVQDMDYAAWEKGINRQGWPEFRVDPLSRRPFPTAEKPFVAVAELPGAPEQPCAVVAPDLPRGRDEMHTVQSGPAHAGPADREGLPRPLCRVRRGPRLRVLGRHAQRRAALPGKRAD